MKNINYSILTLIILTVLSCSKEDFVSQTNISGRVYDKESEEGAEGILIEYSTNTVGDLDPFGGGSLPVFLTYTNTEGFYSITLNIEEGKAYQLHFSDTSSSVCPKYFKGEADHEVDRTKYEQVIDVAFPRAPCND